MKLWIKRSLLYLDYQVVVQSLRHVWLFVTLWTAACQLSSTIFQSLLKFMFIELVMLSNPLTLCHPLLLLSWVFPSIRILSMSLLFASGGQSIGASGQIPYDYTVELRNRFKGLNLIGRVPDELWTEICDIVQETGIKTIPMEKKRKKQNGCLRRP